MIDANLAGYMNGFVGGPRTPVQSTDAAGATEYKRISLRPVSPTIGAVVEGISLAEEIDEELFEEIDRALLEWKVLFFKNQSITASEQQAFAANWGELELHPFFVSTVAVEAELPEVVRLEKDETKPGFENIWHSDVSWREVPSLGSILRAVEVPEVGGDTLWCDMAAAYDHLKDDLKDRIENLVAVHDWVQTFGAVMDPAERDALRPDFPPVEHPVVRVHPQTGRKMLYVNRIFTQRIVGMSEAESAELLEHLFVQANIPEYQCRLRWEAGDVAFWDNRSTQHYANSDYYPARRVMERITIIGDVPVGPS